MATDADASTPASHFAQTTDWNAYQGVPESIAGAGGTPGTRTAPLFAENGDSELRIEDEYPPSAFEGIDETEEGGR